MSINKSSKCYEVLKYLHAYRLLNLFIIKEKGKVQAELTVFTAVLLIVRTCLVSSVFMSHIQS